MCKGIIFEDGPNERQLSRHVPRIVPPVSEAAVLTAERLEALCAPVLECLRAAGEAIMRVYESEDVRLSAKPDDSPLTAADLASDAILQAGLANLVPDCPVISEERAGEWPAERRRTVRQCWLVDPLDGTKEFVARNGEFCVCVALVHDGVAVFGAIHAPVTHHTYVAYRGTAGVRRFDGDGSVAVLRPLAPLDVDRAGLRFGVSRHHAGAQTMAYLATYRSPVSVPMGSALKFCAIAGGALDVYPRFGPTMVWDTAAGQCLLGAVGRSVIDVNTGTPLRYDLGTLTNPGFVAGL